MPATETPSLLTRMAGAPISWGICEVPNWGIQLPVARVLREMQAVGLRATELGAYGWLPTDPSELRDLLAGHDLSVIAAFVPLALHDPAIVDVALASARETSELLASIGASRFVTCLVSDPNDWQRPELAAANWEQIHRSLARIDEICAAYGLTQVIHPHVDSLIEKADEVQRLLDNTATQFCLDTGHLFIGGFDPLSFARLHADRVGLVHLKDVRNGVADRLRNKEVTLMQSVLDGIFPSLGEGDVPIADVVRTMESSGYQGWYVFEQDQALLQGEPAEGEGPIIDVRRSVAYLRSMEHSF